MGWSVDEVRRKREALEKEDASKKAAAAAKASTNTKAATAWMRLRRMPTAGQN